MNCWIATWRHGGRLNYLEFNQRPLRLINPLNANRLHSKAFGGIDIERVIVKEQHGSGAATERFHHMFERGRVWLDSTREVSVSNLLTGTDRNHLRHNSSTDIL
jgi:hypothetical protein